jgi:hypothetical protein
MGAYKRQAARYLKLNPKKVKGPPDISKDVSNLGHRATGDLEITIACSKDLKAAKPFIEMVYPPPLLQQGVLRGGDAAARAWRLAAN